MSSDLAGRTAHLRGDDSVLSACGTTLHLEGVTIVDLAADADIVVAAGGRHSGDLLSVNMADLHSAWNDLTTAVDAYRAALPRMVERGWGRFVWVGSAQARSVDAEDDELAAVTTLGMLGLHKVVTTETGPLGVTANAVLRGGPATDRDVAAAVAFLCSTGAGYLSGVALTVDAGVGSGVF